MIVGLYGTLMFASRGLIKAMNDPNDWASFVARDKAERAGYHPTSAKDKIDYIALSEDDIEMYRGTGAPIDFEIKPGDYLVRVAVPVREDTAEAKT
jgi:hypothetical protein